MEREWKGIFLNRVRWEGRLKGLGGTLWRK